MSRSILHCDMNNFYASVECMLDPALRKYPVAVCGSVEERHGIVLAKNYAAKAYDVKTGDAVWQAKQKCKNLVVVPPHFEEYIKYSKLARSVYKTKFSCSGHPFNSMNEAFTDSEKTASCFVGLVKTEQCNRPNMPIRALYLIADNDFYISFDGVIKNDFRVNLPDGFYWDDETVIRYEYKESEVYELLAERLRASKSLYQWAVTLPQKQ